MFLDKRKVDGISCAKRTIDLLFHILLLETCLMCLINEINTNKCCILNTAWGYCPKDHPYSYFNQTQCCMTDKDDYNKTLTTDSVSCQDQAYRECQALKCNNNPRGG